jgi:GxxExxY protein
LQVEAEVPLPVVYRGVSLECGYRLDLVVERRLVVELKAVQALDALHTAQLLTYLKLSRKPVGLLINFNVPLLKLGIRRVILSSAQGSC